MDNRKDFVSGPEMLAKLEQLRDDIDVDNDNKAYIEKKYTFIGKDGREYRTTAELEMANKMYQETIFSKMERTDNSSYTDTEPSRKMR